MAAVDIIGAINGRRQDLLASMEVCRTRQLAVAQGCIDQLERIRATLEQAEDLSTKALCVALTVARRVVPCR